MKGIIKTVLKTLTSEELVEAFDKNGDGKVSWREIRKAPASAWLSIAYKVGTTIALILI